MTPKISTETHTAHSLLKSCVEQISDTIEQKHAIDKQQFINTHFQDLDDKMIGLEVGALTILAGACGSGKTNLMLSIAQQIAMKSKASVGIVSLRLSASNLMMRVISAYCGIRTNRLYGGSLRQAEWDAFSSNIENIKSISLFVQDQAFYDVDDLLSRIEQLAQEQNCKIIFIDDFPFSYCHTDHANRESERFVFALQQLTRKLNVAVVLTAVLNYDVDKRQDPRPKLSDLYVHGDIVSAADMVMCLYSKQMYSIDATQAITELNILKGVTGKILLKNEMSEYCRFSDFRNVSIWNWKADEVNQCNDSVNNCSCYSCSKYRHRNDNSFS